MNLLFTLVRHIDQPLKRRSSWWRLFSDSKCFLKTWNSAFPLESASSYIIVTRDFIKTWLISLMYVLFVCHCLCSSSACHVIWAWKHLLFRIFCKYFRILLNLMIDWFHFVICFLKSIISLCDLSWLWIWILKQVNFLYLHFGKAFFSEIRS